MYTDADKHLKDFNALNQYQQEDEDIWGEELEPDINEEADEEEILLIGRFRNHRRRLHQQEVQRKKQCFR